MPITDAASKGWFFSDHDPSFELGEVEGFGEEPCAVFRQTTHVVIRNSDAGKKSNVLTFATLLKNGLNEFGPVHFRHIEIGDDDVRARGICEAGTMRLREDRTSEWVIVGQDRVTLALKKAGQRIEDCWIVID